MDLRGFEPLTSCLPVPLKPTPDKSFNEFSVRNSPQNPARKLKSAPWAHLARIISHCSGVRPFGLRMKADSNQTSLRAPAFFTSRAVATLSTICFEFGLGDGSALSKSSAFDGLRANGAIFSTAAESVAGGGNSPFLCPQLSTRGRHC